MRILIAGLVVVLGGCVAYPAAPGYYYGGPVYYAPTPVVVAPIFGGFYYHSHR
ncbi:hypothetical protein [Burkholderia sp. L27(2015)]|uniref:hypothetical protein n=1 Tax=Burkholderia sp. L27(2015) TaxID=1641858 RepID=UPI0020B17677|nr:hypothetical protein [Burkholderia sp. L27(2015)]